MSTRGAVLPPAVTADHAVDRLADDGGPIRTDHDRDRRIGRLVWAPTVEGRRVAGVWWPRSRDARTELGELLPLVTERLCGPATRASLNMEAWGPDQPRRLRVGDGVVRVGWFHNLDPATVTVGRGTYDRVTIAVIPPDIDPATGRELLQRLSTATRWPDIAAAALAGAWPRSGQDGSDLEEEATP
jgi:hypothetical protein